MERKSRWLIQLKALSLPMDKATEPANSLPTENMQLSSCEIHLIEISGAGEEIIRY